MLASVIAACGVTAILLGVIVALGLAVEWLSPAAQRAHAGPRWPSGPMVRERPETPIDQRRHTCRRPAAATRLRHRHGLADRLKERRR